MASNSAALNSSNVDFSNDSIYNEQGDNYDLQLMLSDDEMSAKIIIKAHKKDSSLLRVATLMEVLEQNNIVEGIDSKEIKVLCQKACFNAGTYDAIVAQTTPPQPGKDGWIEALIHTDTDNSSPTFNETEAGHLDLYTLNLFSCVKAEQQIAILHPPQLGQSSSTVTGKVLSPILGQEAEIRLGAGVRVEKNGTSFISELAGRADLIDNVISVSEDYIVHGDVDLEVGNISFPGFTNIRGDVLDHFDINAQKGITVNGTVGNCHLITDGDVNIGSMAGRDEGLIRCGGNLVAKYLNGVTVECMGTVTVQNEIRNSTVKAANIIIIKNGVISGGKCVALNGIEAKDVGAEAGVSTSLCSGVYFPEADLLHILKTQQKSIAIQNQFIKRILGPLEKQVNAKKKNSRAAQTRLDILRERLELLQVMQKDVKQQLEGFVYEEHDSNAKINIHRRLKEKVHITLENISEDIRLEHEGPMSIVADVANGKLRFCDMTALDINAENMEFAEEEVAATDLEPDDAMTHNAE